MSYTIAKNISAFVGLTEPQPDLEVLHAQVAAALATTTMEGINSDGTAYNIVSVDEPSAGEKVAIDAIVAAHTGVGFVQSAQIAESNAEQTTPLNTMQSALSLLSGFLRAGTYLITVSFELMVENMIAGSGVQVSILFNGIERATAASQLSIYDMRSIVASVSLPVLAAPTLEIQYRRLGAANTAQIRRMRAAILLDKSEE